MRFLLPTLTVLCAAISHGQDLTPRQAAMEAVRAVLSRQDQVNWVQAPSKPDKPAQVTHVTASLTDVTVDASTCRLSLKDGRVFPGQHYQSVQTWKLPIPEIDKIRVESLEGFAERLRAEGGQPPWATKTTPVVFVLQMIAAPGEKFEVHRWSRNGENDAIERDVSQSPAFIVFAEEAAAQEAAKMLERAKVLCAQ